MNRFVVLVDNANPFELHKAIQAVRKTEVDDGVLWWHWFQNSWLVVDPKNREVSFWRDLFINSMTPNASVLVLQVQQVTWACFMPQAAHDWVDNVWNKS